MSNKQIQLNRLTISEHDLLHARKFAGYILKKGLHNRKSKESKLVHLAFNTSLIVSYSRPFGRNREEQGPAQFLLSPNIINVLTEDEIKLHNQIVNSRNTEYAHSDADAYSMKYFGLKDISIPISRNPFVPLPRVQTSMLASMIEKWINYIVEEKSKLQ